MTNIYESLLEKMNGKEYNGYFACYCPFDTHKSPALMVNEHGYKCLSCGAKGSLKFLERKISHGFTSSKDNTVSRILPQWRKWEEQWEDLEGIAEHAHQSLKRFPQFQAYYKKRKYENFIDQGYFGYNSGWAVMPCRDANSKVVNIVVRGIKGKGDSRYILNPSKNVPRPLYVANWARVLQSESPVYVVFGVFDVWALESLGLPAITGLTGQNLSPELLVPIKKKLIIIPDSGEERSAHNLANKLGWRGKVKELNWPDGCKDVDEVRRLCGEDTLRNLL